MKQMNRVWIHPKARFEYEWGNMVMRHTKAMAEEHRNLFPNPQLLATWLAECKDVFVEDIKDNLVDLLTIMTDNKPSNQATATEALIKKFRLERAMRCQLAERIPTKDDEHRILVLEKLIQSSLNTFHERIEATKPRRLVKLLNSSFIKFQDRINNYFDLYKEKPDSQSLHGQLLLAEFANMEKLIELDDVTLGNLYSTFSERIENYPDAVDHLRHRLAGAISRENMRYSSLEGHVNAKRFRTLDAQLADIAKYANKKPDLFSGAVHYLYHFIKETNYEVVSYDRKRTEDLRKLAIRRSHPNEPTMGEIFEQAKKLKSRGE